MPWVSLTARAIVPMEDPMARSRRPRRSPRRTGLRLRELSYCRCCLARQIPTCCATETVAAAGKNVQRNVRPAVGSSSQLENCAVVSSAVSAFGRAIQIARRIHNEALKGTALKECPSSQHEPISAFLFWCPALGSNP